MRIIEKRYQKIYIGMVNKTMITKFTPLMQYVGGKSGELKFFEHIIPKHETYVEPFFGGGAVFFHVKPQKAYINDIGKDLIMFYKAIQEQSAELRHFLYKYVAEWEIVKEKVLPFLLKQELPTLADLNTGGVIYTDKDILYLQKLLKKRLSRCEHFKSMGEIVDMTRNLETVACGMFYGHCRDKMNSGALTDGESSALFWLVRELCFGSRIRYNSQGGFNVSYSGSGYNNKDLRGKVDYILSEPVAELMNRADIFNTDFENFFSQIPIDSDTFIFLDPPYDSNFSTYYHNKTFNKHDHERLADWVKNTPAKIMMVIEATPFIENLYKELNVQYFNKKYSMIIVDDYRPTETKRMIITNFEHSLWGL